MGGEGQTMRKTAFIGHRLVLKEGVFELLLSETEKQIKAGCLAFTMGTHGEFDRLALSACRVLRKRYPEIRIEVVLTSPASAKSGRYDDVDTVLFDIEELYYKRRIAWSNRRMIDGCDALICYVDEAGQRPRCGMRKSGVYLSSIYTARPPRKMFEKP